MEQPPSIRQQSATSKTVGNAESPNNQERSIMPEINRSDVTNVVENKSDAVVHFEYQGVAYVYFCWMDEVFESHDGDFEDFDIVINPWLHDDFDTVGIVGRWDKDKQIPVFKDGWLEKSKNFVLPKIW